jgi:pimeloyl-ACP methyl ester carboxylesterase
MNTTIVTDAIARPTRAPRWAGPLARRLELDRRLAGAAAVGIALAAGLATDLFAARGATTTNEGLLIMAIGLAIGIAGGLLARTRWVLIPLVVAYIVGVELGRQDVGAASLAVRLDMTYGIVMFVLARGMHGLLAFVPMTAGVLVGIAAARHAGWLPARRRRPYGTALLTATAAALALLVAMPASTPPVLDAAGNPVPGSIAELATVNLGGQDHTVLIRAADPDKPVLLYLSGGPGQSDLALSRVLSGGWVEDFVFVDLDQRGNGRSYSAIDPVSSMTVDQTVNDVIELTGYLCERFDEEKIYIVGESWGTILGVLAVQQRPDLFHAFIGSGQMANVLETDRRFYADLVAYAERTGDTALGTTLRNVGAPPYRDFPWTNSQVLAWYDLLYRPYEASAGSVARANAANVGPWGLLGSEYAFVDKPIVLRGLVDTFALLYPQLYDIDLREQAATLEVPVWVLDGAAEIDARRDLAIEWFDMLDAPEKHLVTYQDAAHSVAFEQADAVQQLLTDTIVPATYTN